MFEKGEYIVDGHNGICKVGDITHLDMPGVKKERLYYVLIPISAMDRKIYSPVDNDKVIMRKVLTEEAAENLINEITDIEQLGDPDYNFREDEYKEVMKACDCTQWVKIIKTLYYKKKVRQENGKKPTVTEEKYLKMAEDRLYEELAFAIGKEQSEMPAYIGRRIEGNK